jgi:general stress protein 26
MTEKQRKEVLMFVQKNKIAVVATVSPEGEPQAATVTHLMDDDFVFYFVTKKESRKLRNITHEPRIGITIGTQANVPMTVQMQGRAMVIVEPSDYIVTHLTKKMSLSEVEWWPLLKSQKGNLAFIKVEINWLRWLNLGSPEYPETVNGEFQQIIP